MKNWIDQPDPIKYFNKLNSPLCSIEIEGITFFKIEEKIYTDILTSPFLCNTAMYSLYYCETKLGNAEVHTSFDKDEVEILIPFGDNCYIADIIIRNGEITKLDDFILDGKDNKTHVYCEMGILKKIMEKIEETLKVND